MLSLEALGKALEAGSIAVLVCFFFLLLARLWVDSRNREVEAAARLMEPLLHSWLIYDGEIDSLRKALSGVPPHAAFRSLARLATAQVTMHNQRKLARELRGEKWVADILRHARSRLWWKRFDAARLLTVVGTETDESLVAELLQDRSAAVRLVAIDAAARLQGRALIDRELDTLPARQDAVQAYQIAALSRQPAMVTEALLQRLKADAPTKSLTSWIDAAGALVSPGALERVRELASHPDAEVRVHVARALRRLADADTAAVLIRLLGDDDWRVRAQSARSLGAMRSAGATVHLCNAVYDRSWWVRYRSALALAQIGGPAADALRELTMCDDAMARDMSALVAGLSSAAVVEMSEV